MTNGGFAGFPSGASGAVADGSIGPGKLAAPGVWGKFASGNYYITASQSASSTSAGLGNSVLRVYPWYVPNACTLSRIGGDVGTIGEAGSKFRLGIYADNGSFYPGALVLDAGTIAGDSATVQDITISQYLTAGLYWIGGAVQSAPTTQPTMRTCSGNNLAVPPLPIGSSAPSAGQGPTGLANTSVSGALPAVFTASVTASSSVARIHVKVA